MTDVYTEADLYCAAFDFPVDQEIDWLLEKVGRARNVLEPFCGNARYAPAFIARGVEYWGVERSRHMLDRAPRDDPRIHLFEADARSFQIPEIKFDLAWCPINSIRHLLPDEDILAHLERVRDHLAPGGVYIVETDLIHRDGKHEGQPPERGRWQMKQPDGSIIDCAWGYERFDLSRRRVHERATFKHERGDEMLAEISHCYEMRMLNHDDWHDLATRAGFGISAVYQHQSSIARPQLEFSRALDNGADNYYLFLRCCT